MSEVRPAIIADIDRTVITNSILPKSWKCPHCGQRQKMNPFGDETLIEFGKHIQHCKTCGYLHLWELNLTDDFKTRVVGMLAGEDCEA